MIIYAGIIKSLNLSVFIIHYHSCCLDDPIPHTRWVAGCKPKLSEMLVTESWIWIISSINPIMCVNAFWSYSMWISWLPVWNIPLTSWLVHTVRTSHYSACQKKMIMYGWLASPLPLPPPPINIPGIAGDEQREFHIITGIIWFYNLYNIVC